MKNLLHFAAGFILLTAICCDSDPSKGCDTPIRIIGFIDTRSYSDSTSNQIDWLAKQASFLINPVEAFFIRDRDKAFPFSLNIYPINHTTGSRSNKIFSFQTAFNNSCKLSEREIDENKDRFDPSVQIKKFYKNHVQNEVQTMRTFWPVIDLIEDAVRSSSGQKTLIFINSNFIESMSDLDNIRKYNFLERSYDKDQRKLFFINKAEVDTILQHINNPLTDIGATVKNLKKIIESTNNNVNIQLFVTIRSEQKVDDSYKQLERYAMALFESCGLNTEIISEDEIYKKITALRNY